MIEPGMYWVEIIFGGWICDEWFYEGQKLRKGLILEVALANSASSAFAKIYDYYFIAHTQDGDSGFIIDSSFRILSPLEILAMQAA